MKRLISWFVRNPVAVDLVILRRRCMRDELYLGTNEI